MIDYGLFDDFKLMEISGESQKYYIKKDKSHSVKVSDPIIFIDKKSSNEQLKSIKITDETKGASIFYTTDGSDPTINSERYKNAFEISKTAVIKAIAIKEKMLQSNVSIKNIIFGINIMNAVYKNEYIKYSAGGKEGLYDRERGSENFNDGKWQGFEENDMDICFELQKQQKINKICIGFLENIAAWIYFPVKVEIYTSIDGKDFKKISSLTKEIIADSKGDPIKDLTILLNQHEAKFIRIFAKNIEKCPEGDPGSGGKAWIFCDEVMIE